MTGVSNEVWHQLDSVAGRLSRRTAWRLRLGLAGVAALTAVASLLWTSGALWPRVRWSNEGGFISASGPLFVDQAVYVRNDGWGTVRLSGAGRSGPGLELVTVQEGPSEMSLATTSMFPRNLAPGQAIGLVLVYRITDCSIIPTEPWPVPVHVRRPWGVQTVYIDVPPEQRPRSRQVGFYSGPYDEVQWQRTISDYLCSR